MENSLKTVNEKTLYQQFLEAGIKVEEIGTYHSDLHVVKNEISDKIIENYKFKNQVVIFRNQIDDRFWYDIPFGYMNEYIQNKSLVV